jgi:regulator of CtrA degradation
MIDDSLILTPRLIDALYTEAMLLTDEARSYFDGIGREARDALPPLQRVGFSCESLNLTTRLMYAISWLLLQRAAATGEMAADAPFAILGHAIAANPATVRALPDDAQHLISCSEEIYNRIARMDKQMRTPVINPARQMFADLAQSF